MGFATMDAARRWPGATVPFEINAADFPVGSSERKEIDDAILYWNTHTCIRLVPHTTEPNFVRFVTANSTCRSPVGRQGTGDQDIGCDVASVGFDAGSLIHELGHTVGLFHEHKRPDRDEFVEVIEANVDETPDRIVTDFGIEDGQLVVGPYDCGSIMHYSSTAFGKKDAAGNQMTTIRIRDTTRCPAIGQRDNLSRGDVFTAHFIHGILEASPEIGLKTTLGDESEHRPSLAGHDGRLFLAWTGEDDKLNVMLSKDGAGFFGKKTFDEESDDGPALAEFNNQVFIAWTGTDDHLNVARVVRFADTAGNEGIDSLESKVTLPETSDSAPTLAAVRNTLVLGWTGEDEKLNLLFSPDGVNWSGKFTSDESSSGSPALAASNNELFIAWRGESGFLSGNDLLNVAAVQLVGSGPVTGASGLLNKVTTDERSEDSPALASANGRFLMSWRGDGGDEVNIMTGCARAGFYTAHSFSGAKFISTETTEKSPTLAAFGNSAVVGWKGSGNDNLNIGAINFSASTSSKLIKTKVLVSPTNGIAGEVGHIQWLVPGAVAGDSFLITQTRPGSPPIIQTVSGPSGRIAFTLPEGDLRIEFSAVKSDADQFELKIVQRVRGLSASNPSMAIHEKAGLLEVDGLQQFAVRKQFRSGDWSGDLRVTKIRFQFAPGSQGESWKVRGPEGPDGPTMIERQFGPTRTEATLTEKPFLLGDWVFIHHRSGVRAGEGQPPVLNVELEVSAT